MSVKHTIDMIISLIFLDIFLSIEQHQKKCGANHFGSRHRVPRENLILRKKANMNKMARIFAYHSSQTWNLHYVTSDSLIIDSIPVSFRVFITFDMFSKTNHVLFAIQLQSNNPWLYFEFPDIETSSKSNDFLDLFRQATQRSKHVITYISDVFNVTSLFPYVRASSFDDIWNFIVKKDKQLAVSVEIQSDEESTDDDTSTKSQDE